MTDIPCSRRTSFHQALVMAATFLAALSTTPSAHADGPPIIAVIETGGTNLDTEQFRRSLEAELHAPVISMIEADARPVRGMLAVAILSHGRRAAIRYVPAEGPRYAMMLRTATRLPGDPRGNWLVAPCAAAVRTSDSRRVAPAPGPGVIDPWVADHLVPATERAQPGDDPWEGIPRHANSRVWVVDYYVADETENPWAESVATYRTEQAERTAPRRTSRRAPRARTSSSAPAP